MFGNLNPKSTEAFTDSDWAELNKLKRAYESGGQKALSAALVALAETNVHCYFNIMDAIKPGSVREALKDAMAELGVTRQDLDGVAHRAKRREH